VSGEQWHGSQLCCPRHQWQVEATGEVVNPAETRPPDRLLFIIGADEAPPGAPADEFGLVGVAIDTRRVCLPGAVEIVIEDAWYAKLGRYQRCIRCDPGAEPSGATLREAWRVAGHAFDGRPYRGHGGAPLGREATLADIVNAIIHLTRGGAVPTMARVSAEVGYGRGSSVAGDPKALRRAIAPSDWPDLLHAADDAYRRAAALPTDPALERLWHPYQPWMSAWHFTREDLEAIRAQGAFDATKAEALTEAAETARRRAASRRRGRNRCRVPALS
jgi:hypothetical protein